MINFIKPKTLLRPSFLKLGLVYTLSFLIIFSLLNFPVLADKFSYVKNHFSDADEELETELLQASYHQTSELLPQLEGPEVPADSLYIPKINVKAPIILGKSTENNALLKDLEKGVLIYPGSALPGEEGSTVILGHSSSAYPQKFGNVFSLLEKLEGGDLVYINSGGRYLVYRVSDKKTGSVFTLSKSDINGDLILSSCWPVGTDRGRILVSANLIRQ